MALLQEWFGYVLRHDVSQQQFLVLDGDRRAKEAIRKM